MSLLETSSFALQYDGTDSRKLCSRTSRLQGYMDAERGSLAGPDSRREVRPRRDYERGGGIAMQESVNYNACFTSALVLLSSFSEREGTFAGSVGTLLKYLNSAISP